MARFPPNIASLIDIVLIREHQAHHFKGSRGHLSKAQHNPEGSVSSHSFCFASRFNVLATKMMLLRPRALQRWRDMNCGTSYYCYELLFVTFCVANSGIIHQLPDVCNPHDLPDRYVIHVTPQSLECPY